MAGWKLFCEHLAKICDPASPLSNMLFTDSLGLTIKSYRCWQLSLTPEMPQLSCRPANLHRYKVIEAAGFYFVKRRHAVKAAREREVPGPECWALQM